jgi:hypothetical protein
VSDGEETVEIMLEYKDNNKFSAFYKESRTDKQLHSIIEDVETKINPEDETELIFQCEDCQFKMGYLVKPENDASAGLDGHKSHRIILLDSEG